MYVYVYVYENDTGPKFDVVIMDISDPIECGPGIALYFKEFYKDVLLPKMSENSVFVTQVRERERESVCVCVSSR